MSSPKSVTIQLTDKQQSRIRKVTGEEFSEVKFEGNPLAAKRGSLAAKRRPAAMKRSNLAAKRRPAAMKRSNLAAKRRPASVKRGTARIK